MKSLPEIKDQIALDQYGKDWYMLTESQQSQEIDRVAIAYAEQFKAETRKPVFYDSLGNPVFIGDEYFFVSKTGYASSCICTEGSGAARNTTYFKFNSDVEDYVKEFLKD